MTRLARLILLYSVVFIFLLSAPPVLLYAWGYGLDWQNIKPILTGGFYLKSLPKGADIYINNELKGSTPFLVKRLLPGEYQIKITKAGFHSWQKKLKIESKLITEANNILLIPLKPKIEIIAIGLQSDFSLNDFLKQERPDDVYYWQKPDNFLFKTNIQNTISEQISLAPLDQTNTSTIIVSKNKKIAVITRNDNQTTGKLYLLNPEVKDFNLIADNVFNAEFSTDNKKLLYYNNNEIWIYYLENILIQPNKTAGEKELITRFNQNIKEAIWYKDNEHIVFNVAEGVKITELDGRDQRNTINLFENNISRIQYNPDDKMLYFIKGDKLLTMSLEE